MFLERLNKYAIKGRLHMYKSVYVSAYDFIHYLHDRMIGI
jgi:hypothetical protein